jgi:hypothetical protein
MSELALVSVAGAAGAGRGSPSCPATCWSGAGSIHSLHLHFLYLLLFGSMENIMCCVSGYCDWWAGIVLIVDWCGMDVEMLCMIYIKFYHSGAYWFSSCCAFVCPFIALAYNMVIHRKVFYRNKSVNKWYVIYVVRFIHLISGAPSLCWLQFGFSFGKILFWIAEC